MVRNGVKGFGQVNKNCCNIRVGIKKGMPLSGFSEESLLSGVAWAKTELVLRQKIVGQNVIKKFIMNKTLKKFRGE